MHPNCYMYRSSYILLFGLSGCSLLVSRNVIEFVCTHSVLERAKALPGSIANLRQACYAFLALLVLLHSQVHQALPSSSHLHTNVLQVLWLIFCTHLLVYWGLGGYRVTLTFCSECRP